MGIYNYFFGTKQEQRSTSCTDFSFLNQSESVVTEKNVYQIMMVKACVELISDTLAGLSHGVYRKTDKGRESIPDHRVNLALLNPNELQTGFVFKQTMQSHPLINGNAYAWIDTNSKFTKLYLLDSSKTQPKLSNGQLIYETYVGNNKQTLTPDQVFHIPGLGNGIKGMSPIQNAKTNLELAMSLTEFGKSFFSNGAQPGGFIERTGKALSTEAAQTLLSQFNLRHQGARKAFKVGLLEEGAKYTPVGIAPEQAQFLQTRGFSDKAIASQLFKVPLHLVGLEVSTASIEQRGIEFVQFTMLPWVKRWEQEINRKLFSESEKRQGLYFEFNLDSLQRADITTRYNGYNVLLQAGVVNRNEVRAKENWEDIGPLGDKYIQPLNMGYLGEVPPPATAAQTDPVLNPNTLPKMRDLEAEPSDPQEQRQEVPSEASVRLAEATAKHLLTKEAKTISNCVKRNLKDASNPDAFTEFVADFYEGKHLATIRNAFSPILEGARLDNYIEKHVARSLDQLAEAMANETTENKIQSIEEVLKDWQENRALEIAKQILEAN